MLESRSGVQYGPPEQSPPPKPIKSSIPKLLKFYREVAYGGPYPPALHPLVALRAVVALLARHRFVKRTIQPKWEAFERKIDGYLESLGVCRQTIRDAYGVKLGRPGDSEALAHAWRMSRTRLACGSQRKSVGVFLLDRRALFPDASRTSDQLKTFWRETQRRVLDARPRWFQPFGTCKNSY